MTNQEYIDKIRQNLLNGRNTFSFEKDGKHHLFLRVNVGQGEVIYRKVLEKSPNLENILSLPSYKDFMTIAPDRTIYGPSSIAEDTDIVVYGKHLQATQKRLASTLLPELYTNVQPADNLSSKEKKTALQWARELTLLRQSIRDAYFKLIKENYSKSVHDLVLLGEKTAEEALTEQFSKDKKKHLHKRLINEIESLMQKPDLVSAKEKQIALAIQNCEDNYLTIQFNDPTIFGGEYTKAFLISAISNPAPSLLVETKIRNFNFILKDAEGYVLWSNNPKEWTVSTNMGKMPLEDYLEIQADKYGYDSYEALYNAGMRIDEYEDVTPDVFLSEPKNTLQ